MPHNYNDARRHMLSEALGPRLTDQIVPFLHRCFHERQLDSRPGCSPYSVHI